MHNNPGCCCCRGVGHSLGGGEKLFSGLFGVSFSSLGGEGAKYDVLLRDAVVTNLNVQLERRKGDVVEGVVVVVVGDDV